MLPIPQPWPLSSGVEHISVANMGDGCHDSKNDFALSFLVTRGGIPRGLKDLPGQDGTPPPTPCVFAPHNASLIPNKVLDALSAACSASSFPKPGGEGVSAAVHDACSTCQAAAIADKAGRGLGAK